LSFDDCIKAVGTGIKGNRDLEENEMENAIESILEDRVSDIKKSAFLIGLRIKRESAKELKAGFDKINEYVTKSNTVKDSLELGYPFDGKRKNPFISPIFSQYLEFDLIVTSDKALPPKQGVTLLELFSKIKKPKNLQLFDRAKIAPKISNLNYLREEIKLRTVFNTIEKLPNPVNSDFAMIALYHSNYFKLYQAMLSNKYQKALILRGDEGSAEVVKNSTILVLEMGKEPYEIEIDFNKLGIKPLSSKKAKSLDEMISIINNPDDNLIKIAKLNASICNFATRKTLSIFDNYEELLSK